MIELLRELEENTTTIADSIWSITLYGDGSGELNFPDETPLHSFNDKKELQFYVEKLIDCNELLTIRIATEILFDASRESEINV